MLDFPRSSGRREIRIRRDSGKKENMLLGWCGAGAQFGEFNQTWKPGGHWRSLGDRLCSHVPECNSLVLLLLSCVTLRCFLPSQSLTLICKLDLSTVSNS